MYDTATTIINDLEKYKSGQSSNALSISGEDISCETIVIPEHISTVSISRTKMDGTTFIIAPRKTPIKKMVFTDVNGAWAKIIPADTSSERNTDDQKTQNHEETTCIDILQFKSLNRRKRNCLPGLQIGTKNQTILIRKALIIYATDFKEKKRPKLFVDASTFSKIDCTDFTLTDLLRTTRIGRTSEIRRYFEDGNNIPQSYKTKQFGH
ncbi:MAG: hypothetical protein GY804_10620 [Alphaproteobacteria bacterium]|nr:hypothetical protein [Alphaproteobacteria bacterium]